MVEAPRITKAVRERSTPGMDNAAVARAKVARICRKESNSARQSLPEKIPFGRKLFFVDLKENARGRYFKITEDAGGRRSTILVPATVAAEILEALKRLGAFEATLGAVPPTE